MEVIYILIAAILLIVIAFLMPNKPKKKRKVTLADYPKKDALHFGKTFDEWRKMNGYSLKRGSVPDINLIEYCVDCGWPTKNTWAEIHGLESDYLDGLEYHKWLKFIRVIIDQP
jgi:hypothetical protein